VRCIRAGLGTLLLLAFAAVAEAAQPSTNLLRKEELRPEFVDDAQSMEGVFAAGKDDNEMDGVLEAQLEAFHTETTQRPVQHMRREPTVVALEPGGTMREVRALPGDFVAGGGADIERRQAATDAFAAAWAATEEQVMPGPGSVGLSTLSAGGEKGSLLEGAPRAPGGGRSRSDSSKPAPHPAEQPDLEMRRLESLLRWAQDNSILGTDNLEVKYFAKGLGGSVVRGLALKNPVRRGDVVIKVPPHLLLWSEGNATKASFGAAGVAAAVLDDLTVPPPVRLSAGLLALRDAHHPKWIGWLNSLPNLAEYRSYHPVTASEELLKTFHALPLAQLIARERQTIEANRKISEQHGGKASNESWEWSQLVINSRCRGFSGGVAKKGVFLVPVADVINSGAKDQQNLVSILGDPDKGESFEYQASVDIPAGTELVGDGGDHTTADAEECFGSWGFLLDTKRRPVWIGPPMHLDRATCDSLSPVFGTTLFQPKPGEHGVCKPPAGELQKGVFCMFARLSRQHCGPALRGMTAALRMTLVLAVCAFLLLIAAPSMAWLWEGSDECKTAVCDPAMPDCQATSKMESVSAQVAEPPKKEVSEACTGALASNESLLKKPNLAAVIQDLTANRSSSKELGNEAVAEAPGSTATLVADVHGREAAQLQQGVGAFTGTATVPVRKLGEEDKAWFWQLLYGSDERWQMRESNQ